MKTCTFPVGDAGDPCRRPAVAVYVVGREEYLRCKRHDSPKVRAQADEKGYRRVAA